MNEKYTGYHAYKLNGNTIATGFYTKGLPEGEWLYYNKYEENNYKLGLKITYKKGRLDGIVKRWHESFSYIEVEQTYRNDKLLEVKSYNLFPNKNVYYLSGLTTMVEEKGKKYEKSYSYDTLYQIIEYSTYVYTDIKYHSSRFPLEKVYDGPYLKWDNYSKTKMEGTYANGNKIGIWKTYDKNGKLLSEVNFGTNKNLKDTMIVYIGPQNHLKGRIKNQQPIGTWIVQRDNSRNTEYYPFSENKMNGIVVGNHINSTEYQMYKNDFKHGIGYEIDNSTHDTLHVTAYKNGKEHGIEKVFHANGKLKSISSWENGLKKGEELTYSSSGALIKRIFYFEDTMHGLYEEWDEKGNVIEKGRYYYGVRVGTWIELFHDKPTFYYLLKAKKENYYFSVYQSDLYLYEREDNYEILKNY